MSNLIITKEQLKEVVDRKVSNTLRNVNPLSVHAKGYVNTKANFDARNEQARGIGQFLLATINGKKGDAYDIARELNTKYIARANFNTGTTAQGGAVVPEFWVEEIQNYADQFGYARALAKIYPMRGKKEYLASSGNFTASVVAEGSGLTLTDSASFFTQTTLIAKKIVAGAIVSEEELQDATPALLDYMTNAMARAIAGVEDTQYFKGDGSGANFTGILSTSGTTVSYLGASSTSGKTAFSNISWKDLINLRLSVNSSVGANGSFVVPQSVFGFIMKETDAVNGRPIFDMVKPMDYADIGLTALANNTYTSVTGRPIHVVPDSLFPSSAVSTGCAIYADFSQFTIMGIREDVLLQEFTEYFGATGLGGTHQRGISLTERVAFGFPAPSALGILKTSAS